MSEQQYPIVVSPSAIQAALVAGLRTLTVLAGGATAIAGFVGKRDLSGLIAYVQSSDFLAVAGAIAAAASFGYGVWKTYSRKKDTVTLARMVPDAVATVKGDKFK